MTPAARAMRAMESTPGMTPAELAIARSVLYASIFDYPLTLAQLRQTLIESTLTPSEIVSVYAGSEALQKTIEQREGFYFPRGRDDLIAERRRREARSRRFLDHHRRVLTLVAAMPYVRMAALSGSVAHLNLEGDGDLDLFIITKGKRVWSVTVACVIVAKLLRRRRTLCVNFVVADSALALDQQDLFTASQIIHLKPLVGQAEYRRFLAENPFVARFYPNFHYTGVERLPIRPRRITGALKGIVETVMLPVSALVERVCRRAYRAYLVRRSATWRSPEQVRLEPDCLKLHTQSHRQSVLARFGSAVKELE